MGGERGGEAAEISREGEDAVTPAGSRKHRPTEAPPLTLLADPVRGRSPRFPGESSVAGDLSQLKYRKSFR